MEPLAVAFFTGTLVSAVLCFTVNARAVARARREGFEAGHDSRDAEVERYEEELERVVEFQRELSAELREVRNRLTDHRVRVERHEAGLPEIEVAPRAKPHPWSKELREFVSGYRSQVSREAVVARADRLLHQVPAGEVLSQLQREQEV